MKNGIVKKIEVKKPSETIEERVREIYKEKTKDMTINSPINLTAVFVYYLEDARWQSPMEYFNENK